MDLAGVLLRRATLLDNQSSLTTPNGDASIGNGTTPFIPMIRGPNGEIPNYVNPPTRVPIIFGVSISFNILSMLFLIGKLYSRMYLSRRVYFEEYLIVASWVQATFLTFVCCYSTRQGVGYHWWDIPPERFMAPLKFPSNYISSLVYTSVTACIKLAILIFYLRLTPSIPFNRAVKLTMIIVILNFLYSFPANAFQCTPARKAWDFTQEGKCINRMALWITNSSLHVLTDIIIFILPLWIIATSQLPVRQKTQALVIFSLGLVLIVASVVKLQNNIAGITLSMEEAKDFGWGGVPAMAWITMEVNLGVIVACLPGMRPLFALWFPNWFSDFSSAGTPPQMPSPIELRKPTELTLTAEVISQIDSRQHAVGDESDRSFGGTTIDSRGGSRGNDGEQQQIQREEETKEEDDVDEKKQKGKGKSFLDVLKDGKMIKMTLMKSKSGNNLPAGIKGESTQTIVLKREEV